MKYLFAAIVFASMRLCSGSCDPAVERKYVLNDSIVSIVPYQNQNELTLIHSSGTEIKYTVNRQTSEDGNYCDHCCDFYDTYEVLSVTLDPLVPHL